MFRGDFLKIIHIFLYGVFELFLGVGADLKADGVLDGVPFDLEPGLFAVKRFLCVIDAGSGRVGVDLEMSSLVVESNSVIKALISASLLQACRADAERDDHKHSKCFHILIFC